MAAIHSLKSEGRRGPEAHALEWLERPERRSIPGPFPAFASRHWIVLRGGYILHDGSGIQKDGKPMATGYLDHQLECPFCGTIRLRIPADAEPSTSIKCDDCGQYLGTWDELQDDFQRQGGNDGIFRLDKGRIKKLA
ncbi:hypothetical protein LB533_11435 [Mesorhizobium sp. BR1-1-13]|uniref:hypothetical protein n=1 Tax=Mesorhizobium sp. BR1-1-13 TaxID=2876656 RepID=UPI001CD17AC4|nr:hypothetical protein [Mesorhizobium sp. BR1-1-13]MBZ9941719.1 hypothetical protein [Mesorhizobium sp. BR1-1-13]